ncbi:hypothetical protein ACM9HB_33395, partial [Streptomyces sp. JAC128]|uniref:hypothetical protein n=1 Tax=Streptomyces sp. JAC128 TaxID=3418412 RepID=UPI003D813A12
EAPPPMADDLRTRYGAAADTWRTHRADCTTCQQRTPCTVGAPLFERFTRLQEAYLNRRP